MTTGEKIAALRRDHKLSQEALGEKLGLSRQAVSKWEADQAVPTMDNLMELSRLFGVPVDTLLRPDAPFPAPRRRAVQGKKTRTLLRLLRRRTKAFLSLAGKYSPSAARRFCAYLSR